jgi:hypothetical protein
MNRIANYGIGLALLLVVAGVPAMGQNQNPSNSQSSSNGSSLGDYARHIRKDSGAPAKPKVFDNDNLPKDDKLSIVGTARPAAEAATEAKPEDSAAPAKPGESKSGEAKTGETKTDSKPAADQKTAGTSTGDPAADQAAKEAAWKQWGDKLASQKSQIDLLSRELDVLQREYQIRAAAMYADVGNRLRNSTDWDKQDTQYKQQIADKQKAVDDAKQRLDDMQEEARKAGVPSSVREP